MVRQCSLTMLILSFAVLFTLVISVSGCLQALPASNQTANDTDFVPTDFFLRATQTETLGGAGESVEISFSGAGIYRQWGALPANASEPESVTERRFGADYPQMAALVQLVRDERFFDLNERYDTTANSDAGFSTLSITLDNRTKTVTVHPAGTGPAAYEKTLALAFEIAKNNTAG